MSFMVSVNCREVGFDCSFELTGATEHDVIRRFIEHTESEHNIPVLTAGLIYRLKQKIKK
jgi:predicted small metal-binding protein